MSAPAVPPNNRSHSVGDIVLGAFLVLTLGFGFGRYWYNRQATAQPPVPGDVEELVLADDVNSRMILRYHNQPKVVDPLALICVIKGIRVEYRPSLIPLPSPVLIIQETDGQVTITEIERIEKALCLVCCQESDAAFMLEQQIMQRQYIFFSLFRQLKHFERQLHDSTHISRDLVNFAFTDMFSHLHMLNEHAITHSRSTDTDGYFCTLAGDSLTLADTMMRKYLWDVLAATASLPGQPFSTVIQLNHHVRSIRKNVKRYAHLIPTRPNA